MGLSSPWFSSRDGSPSGAPAGELWVAASGLAVSGIKAGSGQNELSIPRGVGEGVMSEAVAPTQGRAV